MTTRTTLRTTIRTELNDSGSTKLWADALLNEYINRAIRTYGRALPKQSSTTIVTTATDTFTLPADCDRITRITLDDVLLAQDPAERSASPDFLSTQNSGASTNIPGKGGTYRVWGSSLILWDDAAASQSLGIEYLARYAEPSADGDTIATPATDDDILQALVCSDALKYIGMDESKRQRFARATGSSPVSLASQYEQRARDAILERKRRVRTSTLTAST